MLSKQKKIFYVLNTDRATVIKIRFINSWGRAGILSRVFLPMLSLCLLRSLWKNPKTLVGFFGRFSYATAVKYVCNIIVMWTGPQACLSLSSVVVLDKDQDSRSGIGFPKCMNGWQNCHSRFYKCVKNMWYEI